MDALTQQNAMLVASVALVLSLATMVALILTVLRQGKLLKRYKLLLQGSSEQNIEGLLLAQGMEIDQLKVQGEELAARVGKLEADIPLHIQKSATIRFNAFPDTGSDLSFAIALLDGLDNGVVISSLYGRSESRVYAKPIQGGKSTYMLSDEEKEALAKATGTAK